MIGIIVVLTALAIWQMPASGVPITAAQLKMYFSSSGVSDGYFCINIFEYNDPDGWNDNWLCMDKSYALRFTQYGDLNPGDNCTHVYDPEDSHASAWNDNWLCTPPGNPWWFQFSPSGPIAGLDCFTMNEPADPVWSDNYLCLGGEYGIYPGYENQMTTNDLGMQWSYQGPIAGKVCVPWNETSDPNGWDKAFLCFDKDYGVKFSPAGTIAGMKCISVNEPSDPNAWGDNYLCTPSTVSWIFQFTYNYKVNGMSCIQIKMPTDPNGWTDNFLCVQGSKIAGWTKINGSATKVSAKGTELWAVTRKATAIRYVNGKWTPAYWLTRDVAASPDGYAWMIAEWNSPNIYRANGANVAVNTWTEPMRGSGSSISVSSALIVIVVGGEGCMWKSVNNAAWAQVGTACNAYEVAIGDNQETWYLDYDGQLWVWGTTTWTKVNTPFAPKSIDVQSKTRVVATDSERKAWVYDGQTWVKMDGNECVQATMNSTCVICVDSKDNIWKTCFA